MERSSQSDRIRHDTPSSNHATDASAKGSARNGTTAPPELLEEIDATIERSRQMRQSDPEEALRLGRRALRTAHMHHALDQRVSALIACGDAAGRLGRADEQIDYYRKAEELQGLMNDQPRRAAVLAELGRMLRMRGELERALELQMISLEIRERLGDPAALAVTLERIATIRCEQGEFEESLKHHLRALELRTETGNATEIIHSLHNIGMVYGYLQDTTTAMEYFRRGLALSEEIGYDEGRAYLTTGLATCLTQIDDPAGAIPLLRQSLELYRKLNLPMEIAVCYNAIGKSHELLNEPELALEALREGLRVARQQKYALQITGLYLSIGSLYQKVGDMRGALIMFSRGLQLAERMGTGHDTLVLHDRLAEVFELIGDYRKTVEHLRQRNTLLESIFGPKPFRGIAALEVSTALSAAEREREILRRRAEEAERESSQRDRELSSMMLNLTRREEALRTVMDVVAPMTRDANDQTRSMARKLTDSISSVLDAHAEFKAFEEQFERVHHEFIRRLLQAAPTHTPTEVKICVLIKCDLSTKEIADSLFSSPLTVKTHRTNIRRKLPLAAEDNLGSYLMSL